MLPVRIVEHISAWERRPFSGQGDRHGGQIGTLEGQEHLKVILDESRVEAVGRNLPVDELATQNTYNDL